MGKKQHIQIPIGDRMYPISVEADEEARIRKIARLLNDMITKYKNNYSTKDWQDALALTCFKLATEANLVAEKKKEYEKELLGSIKDLEDLLSGKAIRNTALHQSSI